MGRPKGSKNKPTIAKSVKTIDLDKHDNIIRDGKKVGTIRYTNDLFVAYVGGVEFRGFDLDEVLKDIQDTIEF